MRNGSARSSRAEAITPPSFFTERTSTQISDGDTPLVTSRSASAATACAWARSLRQRQKRTSPLPVPVSVLSIRSAAGATTACAACEDALARAVVALQPDHGRVRELALEVAQVLLRRAAEAVDRLVVVADHRDVAVLLHQQPQQHALREVRVLVLVHQHVREAARRCARARAASRAASGTRARSGRRSRARRARRAGGRGRRRGARTRARGPACARSASSPASSAQPLGVGHGSRRRETISSFSRSIRDTKLAEQRRGVAADLVVAQRELVDAVEQQRQPVRRRDRREERVDARPRAPRRRAACEQKPWKVWTCSSS